MGVVVKGDSYIDLADDVLEDMKPKARFAMQHAVRMLYEETKRLLLLRHGPESAPPGSPPAMQSGDLFYSIQTTPVTIKNNVVRCGIKSDDPGLMQLEWGGRVLKRGAGVAHVAKMMATPVIRGRRSTAGLTERRRRQAKDIAENVSHIQEPRPFLRPAEENMEEPITKLLRSML